jgi:drug/metabolite transporter superfamily protein YnfA
MISTKAYLKCAAQWLFNMCLLVLATLCTIVLCYGVVAVYRHFADDFDRPLTFNIIGEGILLIGVGVISAGLIYFAWMYASYLSIRVEIPQPKQPA